MSGWLRSSLAHKGRERSLADRQQQLLLRRSWNKTSLSVDRCRRRSGLYPGHRVPEPKDSGGAHGWEAAGLTWMHKAAG